MTIKGIIFDFNGTLLPDSPMHQKAWFDIAQLLLKKPLTINIYNKHVHGRTNKAILTYLLGHTPSQTELEDIQEQKEEYYRQICLKTPDEFKLAQGSVSFIEKVKNLGIPITIATGSYKKNVDFYIDKLNLKQWFDPELIVYDNNLLKSKPAPDMYLQAAKNINIEPKNCLIFEDSIAGVKSAKLANIGRIITVDPNLCIDEITALGGVYKTTNGFNNIDIDVLQ